MQPRSIDRRHVLQFSAASIALGPSLLIAQLPMRESARVVTGYPAGGSFDVVSRTLAERLTGRIARNVNVENRTGAAGRLAVDVVKSAPPDGTAMLITPASVVTMYPHIYKNLAYDVFADLAPVSIVAFSGFAFAVGPSVPLSVRTLGDFIAWCKANPTAAQCGNAGAGSFPHFMAMMFARESRLALGHIPYRGGTPAMQAVAAGQVAAAIGSEASALALEQGGKLRVLATTGKARSPFLPHAATFLEQGFPSLAQREWYAAFMPARTPPDLLASAADAIRLALLEPSVQGIWQTLALSAESSTPAELQSALRTEHEFWGPVIRASGFTPDA